MKVFGKAYRTIWLAENGKDIGIIDQTKLPHEFSVKYLHNLDDACHAIASMLVRGAPLIGATTAYGMALAMRADCTETGIFSAEKALLKTRPTAVNLMWALEKMKETLLPLCEGDRVEAAYLKAAQICDQDVEICSNIGKYGAEIIESIWLKKGKPRSKVGGINILTHCNAGWLATIDWGTATSPIYHAHKKGIKVHVWVDETRPRNQGANLTSYELNEEGVSNTIIADNTGGILMQRGQVDMCITGTDRTLSNGDVANKVGTYLKALAAYDNKVPFYVALPSSTIDWNIKNSKDIPIEERNSEELSYVEGLDNNEKLTKVLIYPKKSKVMNLAFDITPSKYVTGLITEKGVCNASKEGLESLFK